MAKEVFYNFTVILCHTKTKQNMAQHREYKYL